MKWSWWTCFLLLVLLSVLVSVLCGTLLFLVQRRAMPTSVLTSELVLYVRLVICCWYWRCDGTGIMIVVELLL